MIILSQANWHALLTSSCIKSSAGKVNKKELCS